MGLGNMLIDQLNTVISPKMGFFEGCIRTRHAGIGLQVRSEVVTNIGAEDKGE